MIDVNSILGALQGENGRRTAMVGGGAALAGLATGMLAGKSGRKMMGKAAKYGAVERAYLQMLAARLGLDNALVADIHASADATIAPPALEGPAHLTAMRV
jgi:uncharacterized membrane protein YebE (DUF533 family)